jgi:hypothetical protein
VQFYGVFADDTATPLTGTTAICAFCGVCVALVPFMTAHRAKLPVEPVPLSGVLSGVVLVVAAEALLHNGDFH